MITGQTESGLRYAVRKGGFSVGYCALSIRCGTRDEEGYHSGIAHFTEHTLFKGTAHKSAAVVNGYLDRLGGELNAFTCRRRPDSFSSSQPKPFFLTRRLRLRKESSSTRSILTKIPPQTRFTTDSRKICTPGILSAGPSSGPRPLSAGSLPKSCNASSRSISRRTGWLSP